MFLLILFTKVAPNFEINIKNKSKEKTKRKADIKLLIMFFIT